MSDALSIRMRDEWDQRARDNARHYVATGQVHWSDADFFASGEQVVANDILSDPGNIFQGRDPASLRVLEIGCGAGRITRALSKLFGEVHAVDVSGEMIVRAQLALADRPNVLLYQNNGCDLSVVPNHCLFDFAYSFIVFQHIPSLAVIENYVREVYRLLRPGGLFKFQVHGNLAQTHAGRRYVAWRTGVRGHGAGDGRAQRLRDALRDWRRQPVFLALVLQAGIGAYRTDPSAAFSMIRKRNAAPPTAARRSGSSS